MSRCLYDRLTRPKPPPRRRLPLLLGAGVVCLALVSVPALSLSSDRQADPTTPQAAVPSASPTPTPSPTQTPVPAFDFSRPAPQSAPVGMDYFADALFIGDSRTRGLALYSGIRGATFYDYTGLTIFGVGNPGLVTVDGVDCSILEALERGPQFGKIYISFGVNELGYYNEENYLHTFGVFLEQVKALQPGAVVYLQNLAPVHEAKCAAAGLSPSVNNTRVAVFNGLYAQLAREHQVVLVDLYSGLSVDGALPEEATADGVHFKSPWYQRWLDYLMCHTVDPAAYLAGQAPV